MNSLTRWFPLLALGLAAFAWLHPDWFTVQRPALVPLLMLIMLGMGMTLQYSDFVEVWRQPKLILGGVCLQFVLMPLLAYLLSRILQLPESWLIGMVLVGSTAGGTASNVICHLSKGWVALSVSMTFVSTLVSIILTPAMTWIYAGELVDVPVLAMLRSIVQIVVVPVLAGVVLNHLFPAFIRRIQGVSPLVSILGIVWIIAIIVALNAENMRSSTWLLLLAVGLHNGLGLWLGYRVSYLLVKDRRIARTIAIEVGMQNSGMAVVLAQQFFSVAAALPGAIFSIWHNLSGSAIAAWWSRDSTE